MAKEDAYANDILDHTVGNSTWTSPSPVFIALTQAGTEVDSGNAARVEAPSTDWNNAVGGEMTNANAITFPEGGGDAEPDGFAVYDAATDGNRLRSGTLTDSFVWAANTTPEFAPGACTLTES